MKIHGFSLIELMIVIIIIGILSTIAIPSYQIYIHRARFAEVISTTALYKTAVALALQEGEKREDLNTGTHGIPDSPEKTKNLQSLVVKNGIITATGTPAIDETTYILTPNNDGTEWTMSGSCLTNGLCRS
ncbi:MAG TPA: prepilin-type N-terminal cleavage/methylation domain-containing protein [Gammaproteobacteria bacterium]|jgi:prepilin-type N-terminal cleavage/methylation domain-containing protein|nr:prepilin-type N-terminal cleavage/methylation domain-containing protein [Gammaproteobacteria bacterium]